ncbi:MAG TPA: putative glycoside hydrolase [Bacillota bacterium]|nr:putative glycoside hydrolase [Bacillota bacterium]HPT86471.1 putative glycoside hydrolase [Bacillota bacterium]
MSGAARGSIILIGLALIFLFLVSTPSGGAVFPKNRMEWMERFRIMPKTIRRPTLVEIPDLSLPVAQEQLQTSRRIVAPEVRGVYLTSWKAGNSHFVDELLRFAEMAGINAVVVDVKDDSGHVSYISEAGGPASLVKFDPRKLLERFREKGIYPIARIVVFKDPFLAKHCPELAVKNIRGGLWQDRKGLYWVDPYNARVWDYNIAIAKEAARLGFAEIQFDYVRFTSDGPIAECRYPSQDGRTKTEVIRGFLEQAGRELRPLGVKISADVFGLTCSVTDDLGIGQRLEEIGAEVDVICPMVYPSHFYAGQYQIADPDRAPYQTVRRSLEDAKKTVGGL